MALHHHRLFGLRLRIDVAVQFAGFRRSNQLRQYRCQFTHIGKQNGIIALLELDGLCTIADGRWFPRPTGVAIVAAGAWQLVSAL